MKNRCNKNFLFFKWTDHAFELIDIKEDVRKIGEDKGEYEPCCFVRQFSTTRKFRCKNCGEEKEETTTKEEIIRRYY